MAWQDNLGVHRLGARNGCVEVVDLKPQEHAVSVWLKTGIPDGAVMVLHIPSVQLQDQPSSRDQPFILTATVRALTTQQTLIPATARLNITHADQGLRMHTNSLAEREQT